MKLDTTKPLDTPILLLAFNRPEKTARVFESIREVRPRKLYVAVDAPRAGRPDDIEKSNKVKEIVKNVDWPCETHYLFQDKNLGCSLSGVTAWEWLFQHEERMIFIEDDGLASKSAFYFIENLLEKYKDNERIAYIGGVNFGPQYGKSSYYFSRYPDSTYFMGTWKRIWNLYDYDLKSYRQISKTTIFKNSFITKYEYLIRQQQFEAYIRSVKNQARLNSYDIQMIFLSHAYDKLSIYPNVNLVTNIGFDNEASNYSGNENSDFCKEYGSRERLEISEIIHPETISIDPKFEKEFFKKRALFNQHWAKSWFKAWFLNHFGAFYKKWIRPIRRRR